MRTINGSKAQKNANIDPAVADQKKRAAADKARALEKVHNDPEVKAGVYGAILAACRRLCDWKDDAGHIHHGRFDALTTSKKYGEPQFAPLTDWQRKPIQPETLARAYREKYGTKKAGKAMSGTNSKPPTATKSKPKRVTK